jgi:GcrA cell cycle regulator
MRTNEPTWTEERVELLKSRFAAGLSCRQIADEIGVSRNAVIGKLSRLDLTREKSGKARRPARKEAAKAAQLRSVPGLQYQMLKAVYGEPQAVAEGEPIDTGHCCSLLELSAQSCRWPINTPAKRIFAFAARVPSAGTLGCRQLAA